MNLPMSDPELDALLGAYALDALDAHERARVDEYLAVNPQARREVDDLRESAASLALLPAHEPVASPELWSRISHAISEEREVAPNVASLDERRQRNTTARRVTALLAVAASRAMTARMSWLTAVSGLPTNLLSR